MSLQQNPVPFPPQGSTEVYTRPYQINSPQGFMEVADIAFNPLQIPDLKLWLDAADASTITTAIGNAVSGWSDKSGTGNDAAQLVVVDQPETNVETQNGLNVITFTDDFLNIPFVASQGLNPLEFTTFTVHNIVGVAGTTHGILTTQPGFAGGGFGVINSIRYFVFISNNIGIDVTVSVRVPLPGEWIVHQAEHEQTPLTGLFLDGVADGASNVLPVAYTASRDMEIGKTFVGDPVGNLIGSIAEIIHIERKVDTMERDNITNYLKNKWGIP